MLYLKKNVLSIMLVVLVVFAAGALWVITTALNQPANAMSQAPKVTVTPMPVLSSFKSAKRVASTGVKATGNFVSANQVTLAFQLPGRVKEIAVKEGARVKAGTLLASLDTSTLDLQVAQAQALLALATAARDNPQELNARIAAAQAQVNAAKFQVDAARANATSAETLKDAVGGMAIAPQQKVMVNQWYAAQSTLQAAIAASEGAQKNLEILLDMRARPLTLNAQVDAAQAALDLAKQNVTNARIVAPFDGVVVWLGPKVSESAGPGTPVLTLADLSRMQVQVDVDENILSAIQVGQTQTITTEAMPGKILAGRISKISLLAKNHTGIVSVPVILDVDPTDAAIYPGLSATVEFHISSGDSTNP